MTGNSHQARRRRASRSAGRDRGAAGSRPPRRFSVCCGLGRGVLRCPGGIGVAGDTTMGLPRWPDTEWWLAYVEGLPRWLWAVAPLWVGVLAAWACWVQAQTG